MELQPVKLRRPRAEGSVYAVLPPRPRQPEPGLCHRRPDGNGQGNARVSYEHGGTGLGLALARGLAELMKGSLTLVSRPGEGACFTLSLPMNPA